MFINRLKVCNCSINSNYDFYHYTMRLNERFAIIFPMLTCYDFLKKISDMPS